MGVPHILNVSLTCTLYKINCQVSSLILQSTFKTTLLHSQILMFHTVLGTINSTLQFATTHTKPVCHTQKHAQSPLNLAFQQLIQQPAPCTMHPKGCSDTIYCSKYMNLCRIFIEKIKTISVLSHMPHQGKYSTEIDIT